VAWHLYDLERSLLLLLLRWVVVVAVVVGVGAVAVVSGGFCGIVAGTDGKEGRDGGS